MVNLLENGQNKKVKAHLYDGDNQKNKPGRKRTLKPEDEFFLVMCRFRQEFYFMYLRFGTINIWPNREEVDKSMPLQGQ